MQRIASNQLVVLLHFGTLFHWLLRWTNQYYVIVCIGADRKCSELQPQQHNMRRLVVVVEGIQQLCSLLPRTKLHTTIQAYPSTHLTNSSHIPWSLCSSWHSRVLWLTSVRYGTTTVLPVLPSVTTWYLGTTQHYYIILIPMALVSKL
jgi:hypothetical protein